MQWRGRRESDNVVDERSFGTGGKMGIGGLILGAIVYYLMGGNPLVYLAQNAGNVDVQRPSHTQQAGRGSGSASGTTTSDRNSEDADRRHFSSVVLADTEDVWSALFQKESLTYQPPKLVLFRNRVDSRCGRASSSSGPFYCPLDQRVYLDLSFFDELSRKLGAKGDFADAYVIAHEVGHHIQYLLGIERAARKSQARMDEVERNRVSVKIELQADCFAGVWAKQTERTKGVLEPGDIDEALGAASAVGDDRLQRMTQGTVVPDSFTHGSSAQRQASFRQGYDGGELRSCQ